MPYHFYHEQYEYMNDLFWTEPSDKMLFAHLDGIEDFLNELVVREVWSRTVHPKRKLNRYENYVIKHDNYQITLWRVDYIKNNLGHYERHGGELKIHCMEVFLIHIIPFDSIVLETCMTQMIYFVNMSPDW